MVKNNRERETIMGQLRGNFDKNDEYIREILNEETNKMTGDYYGIVVQWWNANMVEQEGAVAITSATLWPQFKKDNEQVIGIMDNNLFKDILMSFVVEKNLVKPKTKTGALKIMNYVLKTN
jgi:hypothetical protein